MVRKISAGLYTLPDIISCFLHLVFFISAQSSVPVWQKLKMTLCTACVAVCACMCVVCMCLESPPKAVVQSLL